MVNTNDIIEKTKLFWQYPVITEKTFYQQNHTDEKYIGIPWATIHDFKINHNEIFRILIPLVDKTKTYYTCCQHIAFRKFIPVWRALNISVVYASHKIKGEDTINGITIKPCPLYAANYEDNDRNELFKDKTMDELVNIKRDILYSFTGAYQAADYMSNIRPNIFKMKHPNSCYVNYIGNWHFHDIVYGKNQNIDHNVEMSERHRSNTAKYNELLLKSRYTLAPSGSGPNSIRFWEALAVGSIPILLSDKLELPEHPLWSDAILIVPENTVNNIPNLLENISSEREHLMRENCIKIYQDLKKDYKNSKNDKIIIHYCCGTYYRGAIGGVARYDYQISLAFPKRIFVQGPQQKSQLLNFLSKNVGNVIVITDNHLACDIPNNIPTILVHHGCAKTTALRNPDWEEPWRSLCCNGQDKMLTYRDTKMTKIVSISQSCTDDFTEYYGNEYLKFDRIPILHPSELDESRIKTTFNKSPLVLGNWGHIKKGQNLIPQLRANIQNFTFNQLNVGITNTGIQDYNRRKQDIYLKHDIFLQIGNSEGFSYAALDAVMCGIPLVSSNVGFCYKDMPEDCFVKLDWKKNGDAK